MCAPIRNYHQKTIHPFPVVESKISQNIKVTETTSFYQLRTNNHACSIDIIHYDQAKVRIDGVFVKEANKEDAHNAANGSHASRHQIAFGQNSLSLCTT